MEIKIKKQLFIYLLILFFFSIFHLNIKSSVGNDSTIAEWLINYTGGFTKRGIIGQISIFFSRLFSSDLRDTVILGSCAILLYISPDRLLIFIILSSTDTNPSFVAQIYMSFLDLIVQKRIVRGTYY